MSDKKPINIGKIPAHVRLPVGTTMRKWLRMLDKAADAGSGKAPDGKFTEANFKYFQSKSLRYLKRHASYAMTLKGFKTFASFKAFIERYNISQRCSDPEYHKAFRKCVSNLGEKTCIALSGGDFSIKIKGDKRTYMCTLSKAPTPPPIPRDRPRRPRRLIAKKPKKLSVPKLLAKLPPKKKADMNPRKKQRIDKKDVTFQQLKRAGIRLPDAKDDPRGLRCRSTSRGPECSMNGRVLSRRNLCLPKKPNLAAILKMRIKKPVDPRKSKPEGWRAKIHRDGSITFIDKNVEGPFLRGLSVAVKFDLTDMLMRALGQDPYAAAKLRYMEKTRPMRMRMRKRWRKKIEKRYFSMLDGRLASLWRRTDWTDAKKRAILFELWDECLEPGAGERRQKAQRARRIIIRFIRRNLPKGSPLAYTASELARFRKRRIGQVQFNPY